MIVMTPELEHYSLSLLRICASVCDVPFLTILSVRRQRKAAQARAVFFRVMRSRLRLSYPELAAILGIDHSTVMLAVQRAQTDKVRTAMELTDGWASPEIQRPPRPKPKPKPSICTCPYCGKTGCKLLKAQPGYRFCVACRSRWVAN